jgi:LacI family transcriptional regulator
MENKQVTQNDVAREAGVTRSMVSYVINGTAGRSVAPETRQRILEVIERLGYRPNKAAQALQLGDVGFAAKRIGVVLRDSDLFRRPYYAEIIAGIHTAAYLNNYKVVFIRFFEEFKDPVLFNELIHEEEIGGLILVATDQCIKNVEDTKLIQKMKERIKKIVCVDWKFDGLSSVSFDRRDAAKKAASFVIKKGYTDISYVGELDDRVNGIEDVLVSKCQVFGAFDMSGGYKAVAEIQKNGHLPRAIVCGSDEVAYGVLCHLNELNISVPAQVAVVSIDDLETSSFITPPLTTVNVHKQGMGQKAVEMIVSGTAGQGENALQITLPTELIKRASV